MLNRILFESSLFVNVLSDMTLEDSLDLLHEYGWERALFLDASDNAAFARFGSAVRELRERLVVAQSSDSAITQIGNGILGSFDFGSLFQLMTDSVLQEQYRSRPELLRLMRSDCATALGIGYLRKTWPSAIVILSLLGIIHRRPGELVESLGIRCRRAESRFEFDIEQLGRYLRSPVTELLSKLSSGDSRLQSIWQTLNAIFGLDVEFDDAVNRFSVQWGSSDAHVTTGIRILPDGIEIGFDTIAVEFTVGHFDIAVESRCDPSSMIRLTAGGVSLSPGFRSITCAIGPSSISDVGTQSTLALNLSELEIYIRRSPNGVVKYGGRIKTQLILDSGTQRSSFTRNLFGEHSKSTITTELTLDNEGIRFRGSGGLGVDLPINVRVGPARIDSAHVSIVAEREDSIQFNTSLTLSGSLGPIHVQIRRIGLRTIFSTEGNSLGFGGFDMKLLSPSGIALQVVAGAVTGGGFISFDSQTGRYMGIVSLAIGSIIVRALGVLDTRAPGVSGYSFLIVISAEFTPIQLGFGFTLNGVGGLCGIQRAVAIPALEAGVRDGTLAPLLFARDPTSQASRLVTALQRIFPPTQDRYVFGPMFKLAWGTPVVVTADIGILLLLPAPVVIVLIGQIVATFPKPQAAIIKLNIDVAGTLDTGEKRLAIDASLRDSKIAGYDITGDMALRFLYGSSPDFALSVGGFNPSFRPPPTFPTLRRLTLSLNSGAVLRYSCAAYFALTPNSLQFGARAELFASALGFNILGYFEFHALFIFSPFSFRFDFSAGVAIRRGTTVLAGVSVVGLIEGPSPWHLKGRASISLVLFSASVSFDRTFGNRAPPDELRPIDVWARLRPALEDVRSWSATLPGGRSRGVSVASDQEVPAQVRLDPFCELAVRQKVLPLERRLTKLGEGSIEGPCRYRVTAIRFGTDAEGRDGVALRSEQLREPFAAGQYENLSDAERLSRPSFEPMVAGALVKGALSKTERPVPRIVQYRTIRADRQPPEGILGDVSSLLQEQLRSVGAAELSSARMTGMERYAPSATATPFVTLAPETFALASTANITQPAWSRAGTWGEVADTLRQTLVDDPNQTGAWQVVPTYEVRP